MTKRRGKPSNALKRGLPSTACRRQRPNRKPVNTSNMSRSEGGSGMDWKVSGGDNGLSLVSTNGSFAATVDAVLDGYRQRVAERIRATPESVTAADLQQRLAAIEAKARTLDGDAAGALQQIRGLQSSNRPDSDENVSAIAALDRTVTALHSEAAAHVRVSDELRRRLEAAQAALLTVADEIATQVRAECLAETATEAETLLASLPAEKLQRLAACAGAGRRATVRG